MHTVTAYLEAGVVHEFDAESVEKAREIANRIVREGLWVVEKDGTEVFIPSARVFKVKVEKKI